MKKSKIFLYVADILLGLGFILYSILFNKGFELIFVGLVWIGVTIYYIIRENEKNGNKRSKE